MKNKQRLSVNRPDLERIETQAFIFSANQRGALHEGKSRKEMPIHLAYEQGKKLSQQDCYLLGRHRSLYKNLQYGKDWSSAFREAVDKAVNALADYRSGTTFSGAAIGSRTKDGVDQIVITHANLGDSPIYLFLFDSHNNLTVLPLYTPHNANSDDEIKRIGEKEIILGRYCPEEAVLNGQSQGCEVTGAIGDTFFPKMQRNPAIGEVVLDHVEEKGLCIEGVGDKKGKRKKTFYQRAYVMVSSDGIFPDVKTSTEEQINNYVKEVLGNATAEMNFEHNYAIDLMKKIVTNYEEKRKVQKVKADNITILIHPILSISMYKDDVVMSVFDGHGTNGQKAAFDAAKIVAYALEMQIPEKQLESTLGTIIINNIEKQLLSGCGVEYSSKLGAKTLIKNYNDKLVKDEDFMSVGVLTKNAGEQFKKNLLDKLSSTKLPERLEMKETQERFFDADTGRYYSVIKIYCSLKMNIMNLKHKDILKKSIAELRDNILLFQEGMSEVSSNSLEFIRMYGRIAKSVFPLDQQYIIPLIDLSHQSTIEEQLQSKLKNIPEVRAEVMSVTINHNNVKKEINFISFKSMSQLFGGEIDDAILKRLIIETQEEYCNNQDRLSPRNNYEMRDRIVKERSRSSLESTERCLTYQIG